MNKVAFFPYYIHPNVCLWKVSCRLIFYPAIPLIQDSYLPLEAIKTTLKHDSWLHHNILAVSFIIKCIEFSYTNRKLCRLNFDKLTKMRQKCNSFLPWGKSFSMRGCILGSFVHFTMWTYNMFTITIYNQDSGLITLKIWSAMNNFYMTTPLTPTWHCGGFKQLLQ